MVRRSLSTPAIALVNDILATPNRLAIIALRLQSFRLQVPECIRRGERSDRAGASCLLDGPCRRRSLAGRRELLDREVKTVSLY